SLAGVPDPVEWGARSCEQQLQYSLRRWLIESIADLKHPAEEVVLGRSDIGGECVNQRGAIQLSRVPAFEKGNRRSWFDAEVAGHNPGHCALPQPEYDIHVLWLRLGANEPSIDEHVIQDSFHETICQMSLKRCEYPATTA